ncbi:MAG: hypothetical protein Q7U47_00955 [Paludibacter sp.]|nr:hypothetical protein [Paludibacter sp.]
MAPIISYRSDRSAVEFDAMIMNNGEVYVCGYESNASTGKWEALLIKYSSVGDAIWTRKVSAGSSLLSVYKLMTSDIDGNVYVTGLRENTVITAK